MLSFVRRLGPVVVVDQRDGATGAVSSVGGADVGAGAGNSGRPSVRKRDSSSCRPSKQKARTGWLRPLAPVATTHTREVLRGWLGKHVVIRPAVNQRSPRRETRDSVGPAPPGSPELRGQVEQYLTDPCGPPLPTASPEKARTGPYSRSWTERRDFMLPVALLPPAPRLCGRVLEERPSSRSRRSAIPGSI